MGPFHMPWSSFGAVLLVALAIVIAVVWALADRRREEQRAQDREGHGAQNGGRR